MWVTGNSDCATNPTAVGKAAPLAIFLCLTLKEARHVILINFQDMIRKAPFGTPF
jgi:hypothetical protein